MILIKNKIRGKKLLIFTLVSGDSDEESGARVLPQHVFNKFDQEISYIELKKMFIVVELPFRFLRMRISVSFLVSYSQGLLLPLNV